VPKVVVDRVIGIQQVTILTLGVLRQVAIGLVDHLHDGAHPPRQCEDAHPRREAPRRDSRAEARGEASQQ
jgi:hypothetical protein